MRDLPVFISAFEPFQSHFLLLFLLWVGLREWLWWSFVAQQGKTTIACYTHSSFWPFVITCIKQLHTSLNRQLFTVAYKPFKCPYFSWFVRKEHTTCRNQPKNSESLSSHYCRFLLWRVYFNDSVVYVLLWSRQLTLEQFCQLFEIIHLLSVGVK